MSSNGPAKSNCSSSLGSLSLGSAPSLDLGIIGFKFLPWSRRCLQFSALRAMVRCIWGNQIRFANLIPLDPGGFGVLH